MALGRELELIEVGVDVVQLEKLDVGATGGSSMAGKKWIKGAIKRPGVFRAKAKSMGVSTATLARRWKGKAGVWGKRARLALTLSRLPRRGGATRSRKSPRAKTRRRTRR